MRKLFSFAALTLVALAVVSLEAQTPEPVIMEAATPDAPAASARAAATAVAAAKDVLQLLQDRQATNAETIKKQDAALETLDALQKAADELKIFSKRG